MRMIVYRPGLGPSVEDVEGFEGIRRVVGGYIERVVLDADARGRNGISLWCDEDGIAKGLPVNVLAVGPTYLGAPICGVAVIARFERVHVGTENEDEEERDLTDEDIARWSQLPRIM